jgi:hypothetical protein
MTVSLSMRKVLWKEIAGNSIRELHGRMNVYGDQEKEKEERIK